MQIRPFLQLPSPRLSDLRNMLCYSCGAVEEDGEMVWVAGEQGASPGALLALHSATM